MKEGFDIKDITTYRSELMGWSIIWIMMLHFTFIQIKPLGFIAQYGFAGVDIFIFVSGFGIFYSLDKDCNIGHFYKRRLLRIFPTYYFIGLFASLFLFHDNILTYLFRYSTLGFWIGGPYWAWYIPAIISLYLFAPIIKLLIDKKQFILLSCISIFILMISYYIMKEEIVSAKDPHFFLLYRIPAFIFGMVCAYWIKKENTIMYYLLIMLIGIPFFIFLFPYHHTIYNYKYYSLLFLLPSFILVLLFFFKYIKLFNTTLSIIGKASLEIYLIQGVFFHAINTGQLVISSTWHDIISIALITCSSLLGIFIHWLIDIIKRKHFI